MLPDLLMAHVILRQILFGHLADDDHDSYLIPLDIASQVSIDNIRDRCRDETSKDLCMASLLYTLEMNAKRLARLHEEAKIAIEKPLVA